MPAVVWLLLSLALILVIAVGQASLQLLKQLKAKNLNGCHLKFVFNVGSLVISNPSKRGSQHLLQDLADDEVLRMPCTSKVAELAFVLFLVLHNLND